jgi:sec-independent protein translocase protein TatC
MAAAEFDPDQYRMTVGEHLEELRRRLIHALVGFFVVLVICLTFAKSHVVPAFCAPLTQTQEKYDINAQLVTDEVGEAFMVYIKISIITAAALSAPWMLYQLWLFVAAGLYPAERKYITRYLPLSIILLISGMMLVYFLVLPWTLDFFIGFGMGIPQPGQTEAPTTAPITQPFILQIPSVAGEPVRKVDKQLWFDTVDKQLKFFVNGQTRVISFGSSELVRQEFTLSHYIDLVVAMLIAFGLSFQLPLVVLTLARIGIIEVDTLRNSRRYVYFSMAIAAAIITPGQDIPSLIGLTVPLCLLFELGIWLAREPAKSNNV